MNNYSRWAVIVGALLLAATVVSVGMVAYNAGVTRGIEQSGKIIVAPVGAVPYYGWRPWGSGFFFAPLFFIAFWLVIMRGLFGRGGWHRRGCHAHERYTHERMCSEPEKGAAPER
jgi:hypothetical protein